VNSLIHADYRGQGGIVIEKYRDRFEVSNPGTLLLSIDQILTGGISECRNKALQTMFLMIGGGERAGSGMDKIRQGWRSQHWRYPGIQQQLQPDRVRLILPMVSLLPEDSLERLQSRFGERFTRLSELEVQALVTAEVEGGVTNVRLREMSGAHPADVTGILQGLVTRGFLLPVGQKRWTIYRLPQEMPSDADSAQIGKDSSHMAPPNSSHMDDSSHKQLADLSRRLKATHEEVARLVERAAPARKSRRLCPDQISKIILQLCYGRYLTAFDLAMLMDRNAASLRNRFLTPMVEKGLLERKYLAAPNRPDQAYTSRRNSATEKKP
jgi:ATP-dependent DNA helicase RecG